MTVSSTTDAVVDATDLVKWDISIDDDGDILTDDFLDTSMLMTVFCEKRASASEVPAQQMRRGWIGNESFIEFEIGSKIWLYTEQPRLTQTLLNNIKSAAQEGFEWFVSQGIAESVTTDVQVIDDVLNLTVVMFRANSQVERRLYELWNASGVTLNPNENGA